MEEKGKLFWFNDKRGMTMGIAFIGSGIRGHALQSSGPMGHKQLQLANGIILVVLFLAVTLPFVIFIIRLHPTMKGMTALGDANDLEEAKVMHSLSAVEAIITCHSG